MHVSAVILAYNGLPTLPAVLAAVRAQSRAPAEIIVVDNGSTDGTQDYLREKHSDLELVLLDRNYGVGAGHNAGWAIALRRPECRFIWSLEHDSIPADDCLEVLVRAFEERERTKKRPPLGGVIPFQAAPYLEERRPTYVWRRGRFWRLGGIDDYPDQYVDSRFTFNGTLFDTRAIRAVGMLRTDFFVGYEDYDYRYRMSSAGFMYLRILAARVHHDPFRSHPVVRLFGRNWYLPGGQSVSRSYYATRNSVYLERQRSKNRFFALITVGKLMMSILYTLISPRAAKLQRVRARIRGVADGLAGDLGERSDVIRRKKPSGGAEG